MSDSDKVSCTLLHLREAVKCLRKYLLSNKSWGRYDKIYDVCKSWCSQKGVQKWIMNVDIYLGRKWSLSTRVNVTFRLYKCRNHEYVSFKRLKSLKFQHYIKQIVNEMYFSNKWIQCFLSNNFKPILFLIIFTCRNRLT